MRCNKCSVLHCYTGSPGQLPAGPGPGERGEGGVGLQGPQADDQDQLPAQQLRGDDAQIQAAAHIHQNSCHEASCLYILELPILQ
jgi:hypothetical protein